MYLSHDRRDLYCALCWQWEGNAYQSYFGEVIANRPTDSRPTS